ncbi:MAG: hypothetical protein Q4G03_10040 [Planctomycetia bacterium]|nr:hypothetical protein [Planctomycetia bacterium]
MRSKMKLACSLALALAATLCACARAAQPQWAINNGSSNVPVVIGQGFETDSFGIKTIKITGADSTFTVGMNNDEVFEAAERPFFAVRYRAQSEVTHGGVFFTNDKDLASLSDKSFTSFPIEPDGQWHDLIVNLAERRPEQWQGKITSFRLDLMNPSAPNDCYSISRLGFFPTQEAAREYLAQARDESNFDMEYVIHDSQMKVIVPGGVFTSEPQDDQWRVTNAEKACKLALSGVARESLVVVRKQEQIWVPEPISYVNSRGYVSYLAKFPGERRVVDFSKWETVQASDMPEDPEVAAAIRFVLARNLMLLKDGKFLPNDSLSEDDARLIAQTLRLSTGKGPASQEVERLAQLFEPAERQKFTRADFAQILANGIANALGTRVISTYTPEYFQRERIRIGGWGNFQSRYMSDDVMRAYADCGFDFMLALNGAAPIDFLKAGDRYGFEVYVNDGSYQQPEVGANEYYDHPSFGGCYVTDEPGTDQYDRFAALCNPYAKITGKTPYVNLLPMYANAAQLKFGAGAAAIEYYDSDPELFRNYCAEFCKKFNVKYICTDIYPLNWKDGVKTTYPEYVESINQIASVAREYDREFWCFIQTFGWIASKRTPNESEYRWQCYSMLSFGCKGILCWTYAGYKPEFPSLIDINGNKTSAWYDARAVFWEIRRLSDVFVKYRNVGAFTVNCTDETPYLKMSNEYKDFQPIESLDSAEPLLVGCFDSKEGDGAAFTVVNMTELEDASGATARVQLRDGYRATTWYRGVPEPGVLDADGKLVINLATGEGVFVTLERDAK